jgi:protein-tyrosine kinase
MMEHIRQAVERAKNSRASDGQPQAQLQQPYATGAPDPGSAARNETVLNATRLEAKRIIAHDIADPRSKSFDMLRTQVLQSMDANSWQFLGVVSPTAGCGKSVVSTNLALSIARQPERSVLLVDMDLQKPQIANQLGLRCNQGLISLLEGKTALSRAIIPSRVRNSRLFLLPCETSVLNSSEWMASRAMSALLNEIRRDFKNYVVIFDLPPILLSDDVISILPQIDCALFVAAAGYTSAPEIRECNKHLESTPVVRVVLNKATDATPTYYYSYSRYGKASASQGKTNGQIGGKTAGFARPAASSIRKFVDRLTRF